MSSRLSDQSLLFGVLAYQLDFISSDQLTAAMAHSFDEGSESLAQVLQSIEAIGPADREAIEQVVARHVQAQEGVSQDSLSALCSSRNVQEVLSTIDLSQKKQLFHEATVSVATDRMDDTVTQPVDSKARASTVRSPLAGRYTTLRHHAEGGLGTVSVALDQELNREVALKEIKDPYSGDEASRARFTLEAEITGGLEHPGIVPVYGLGHRDDGRPYYAMRFIKGDSLKEACLEYHKERGSRTSAENSLEFRKLLGRFTDVCNAIEYAHSRGVLHRDLKPGNVMLGNFGETLVVDWGLAKVAGQDDPQLSEEGVLRPSSADSSPQTQMGSALGTPQFMSPEQAAGRLDELGPASDVYSLGATFYYVLTGHPPIKDRNLEVVLDRVQAGEFEPPRTIDSGIPRPLEAICLKSMELERKERYQSAAALADDIDRYLADEPVRAYAEPSLAKIMRWIRRHKAATISSTAVIAIVLVALTIITGVVTASNRKLVVAYDKLDSKNNQLRDQNARLELANEKIARNETNLKIERDATNDINNFYREDLLMQASPSNDPDRDVKLRTVLDRAEQTLEGRFPDQPLIEGSIRFTLAQTYYEIGEYETAERNADIALDLCASVHGQRHLDVLTIQNLRSQILGRTGRLKEAEEILEKLSKDAVEVVGEDGEITLTIMNNKVTHLIFSGRLDEAERVQEEALTLQRKKLGELHYLTIIGTRNLGDIKVRQGKLDQGISLLEKALDNSRLELGQNDSATISSIRDLSSAYRLAGRLEEAQALLEECLSTTEKAYGPSHSATINTMAGLGEIYLTQNNLTSAEGVLSRAFTISLESRGETQETLQIANSLAFVHRRQEQFDEALKVQLYVVETATKLLGESHQDTLAAMSNLGTTYSGLGRHEEAVAIHRTTLDLGRRKYGNQNPLVIVMMNNLAAELARAKRSLESLEIYELALKSSASSLGRTHPYRTLLLLNYGVELTDSGRYRDAADSLTQACSIFRAREDGSAKLASSLATLATAQLEFGDFAEAEKNARESLAIRKELLPDEWVTFNAESVLGHALMAQKAYTEAEPLLANAQRELVLRMDEIPAAANFRVVEATLRLVELYERLDEPLKAADWRRALVELRLRTGVIEEVRNNVLPPSPQ